MVPLMGIFDLNIFSTRLLSAIIGSLTVLSVYLLAQKMFNKNIALIAAIFVSFSPWGFHFSRVAYRGILVPLFVTLGLYFFYKAFEYKKYLIISSLLFALSIYTYSTMRAFIPLLLMLLSVLYFKEIKAHFFSKAEDRKLYFFALLLFLILALPIFFFSILGEANSRFDYISVFATKSPLQQFLINLDKSWSFSFLFINGDANLRHSINGYGQILVVLYPFIIFAYGINLVKNQDKKVWLLFLVFLIGIIPSALTNEVIPHSLRAIAAFPFLEMAAAYGIFHLSSMVKWKKQFIFIFVLLFTINATSYLKSYFKVYAVQSKAWFQYRYFELMDFTNSKQTAYDQIYMSESLGQPSIFILFYNQFDPAKYHASKNMGKNMFFVRKQSMNVIKIKEKICLLSVQKNYQIKSWSKLSNEEGAIQLLSE